jgi:hypothetical protein
MYNLRVSPPSPKEKFWERICLYPLIIARPMNQVFSRRPRVADIRFQSQATRCEICGGKSGSGTGFCPST